MCVCIRQIETTRRGICEATYRSLGRSFEIVTAFRIVADVKRMVASRTVRILAAFDDERVRLTSDDGQFRGEQAVDVPSDVPTDVA